MSNQLPDACERCGEEDAEEAGLCDRCSEVNAAYNRAEAAEAVMRPLLSVVSEDAVRETLCCYTQGVVLLDALAAYEAALKGGK
jgi:predicted ATP-dependent serine protease